MKKAVEEHLLESPDVVDAERASADNKQRHSQSRVHQIRNGQMDLNQICKEECKT